MHQLKTYLYLGLCFVTCLVFVSGCKAVPQDKSVAIGVNLSLSGQGQSYGESTERGIELAKDKVNEAGGLLGQPVQLITVDNHGMPDDASAAVKELSMRHVSAIIGPNMTDCAMAVISEAEAEKIPVISPAGTHPDITVDGKTRDVYRYMFRATFIDAYQGRAMANYAFQKLNGRTAAVVYDDTSKYSRGLAEFFRKAFEAAGGKVPLFLALSQSGGDLAGVVTSLQAANCDVIYAPFYDEKAAAFISLVRGAGVTKPLLGPDGWNGPKLAQSTDPAWLVHLYYTDHYANDVKRKESEDFAEAYYEKYGLWPDSYAALGYDSFMMAADAVTRSQSSTPKDVAVELAKTIDFNGVTGNISLDANHDAVKAIYIMTFWKGEPALLEKENTVSL